MKKYLPICLNLIQKIRQEDLSKTANDMTYKLLLALFPLLMFLLTVLGFFELDIYYITDVLADVIPTEILGIVEVFTAEVVNVRRPSLLSFSILFTLYSASGGFRSMMSGVNAAYGLQEKRGPIQVYAISLLMVLTFTLAIVFSIVGIVFSTLIIDFLRQWLTLSPLMVVLYNFLTFLVTFVIVIGAILCINRISLYKKIRLRALLPGAIFTALGWLIASGGFSIYVTNWGNMASVYGSVGGFMVLMIWLNILCHVLVIGAGFNAVVMAERKKE